MVQGCRYRVVAGALAGVVLLSGCASAPAGRFVSADAAQESPCLQPTREAAGPPSWVHAVGFGIAGVAMGAFWGASEGVRYGLYSGASTSGQAAWIGAAAGAGLGLMIGLVAGAIKGREAWPSYRPADKPCGAADAPADATLAQAEKDASNGE